MTEAADHSLPNLSPAAGRLGAGMIAHATNNTIVVLVTLAALVASLFSQVNLSAGEREDRANRWVIPAFGALGLALAIAPAYADRIGLLVIGGEGLRWIGVVLYAAGGVLRLVDDEFK